MHKNVTSLPSSTNLRLGLVYFMLIVLIAAFAPSYTLVAQALAPEDKTISIYFGGGSYYIDEEQASDLVRFIEEVDNIALYQIEVHGHTDNIGSRDFNLYLSHMRCEEVIYELTNMLIEPETIFQYDHGEDDPDFDNDIWQGKLHNRRVDVILRKLAI